MSGEQVLRAMWVKQLGSFSDDELAFHLADSTSYRALAASAHAEGPNGKDAPAKRKKKV